MLAVSRTTHFSGLSGLTNGVWLRSVRCGSTSSRLVHRPSRSRSPTLLSGRLIHLTISRRSPIPRGIQGTLRLRQCPCPGIQVAAQPEPASLTGDHAMFHLIDAGLRQALVRGIPGLTANDVGFDPPNADWRQRVGSCRPAADQCLYDRFRENRRLRKTEPVRGLCRRQRHRDPGSLPGRLPLSLERLEPRRRQVRRSSRPSMNISSWATSSRPRSRRPFVFARSFEGLPLPPGTPPELVEHELPLTLLPVEGFPKLVEFWGTMGEEAPAKPVVHLIITAPFFAPPGRPGRRSRRSSPTTGRPARSPARCCTRSGEGSAIGIAPLPDGTPSPVASACGRTVERRGPPPPTSCAAKAMAVSPSGACRPGSYTGTCHGAKSRCPGARRRDTVRNRRRPFTY